MRFHDLNFRHEEEQVPAHLNAFVEEHFIAPILGKPEDYKKKEEYTYLRAAYDKDFKKVIECLRQGVNINVQSPNSKFSVLHCALYQGKLPYALLDALLAQPDLNVNVKNNSGQTPFNFACSHLMHSYENSEKNDCYTLFQKLLQRGGPHITEQDIANINWEYLKQRKCEYTDIENLIKQRLLISSHYIYKSGAMMKTIQIPMLIALIEKKLHKKFDDVTLCTQYAWWLLQVVTQKDEVTLISLNNIPWSEHNQAMLDDYLGKLINKDMPLSYLLGSAPFCGLDIITKPPVLIPRPETEEWTANLIDQLNPLRNESLWILDLCTGSGCIALALADALPKATIYGTDISDTALALANENKRHNHIPNVQFLHADCFDQIPKEFKFDLDCGKSALYPRKSVANIRKLSARMGR